MNKLIIITRCLLALLLVSACSEDHVLKYTAGTFIKSAEFTNFEDGSEYILQKELYKQPFAGLTWTASEYTVPVGINYTVELDLYKNKFEKPAVLANTTNTNVIITVGEMNDAIYKLGITKIEPVELKMRIVTSAYGGEKGITPLMGGFPVIKSDSIYLVVTTCEQPKPKFPEHLYMIGADFGKWNWEDPGIVEMVPVNGKLGEFWCINYFTAGHGFKWSPAKSKSKEFANLGGKTEGLTFKGDTAFVATDGLYMIFIDYAKKAVYCETAKVYGKGDCFGGWDGAGVPFTIEGKLMKATTTAGGELRFYAGSDYSLSDWWTREFMIFGGEIVYRGNGGDQARVPALAGQVVTLDFKAGTGTIE